MNIHPTTDERPICPCGAVISDDEHSDLCAKCRSRARWERRSAGRRQHERRESQRDGGRS